MSARKKRDVFCEIQVFQRVHMKDKTGNFIERSIGDFNVIDWLTTFEIIQWLSTNINDIDNIKSRDPNEIPIKISIKTIKFGNKKAFWIKYMYYEQYISFIQKIQEYIVPGNSKIIGRIHTAIPQSSIPKYHHSKFVSQSDIGRSTESFCEIKISLRSHGNMYGDSPKPQTLNIYTILDWQLTGEIIRWLSSDIEDIGDIESIHPDEIPFIIEVNTPIFEKTDQIWTKYLNFNQYIILYNKLEQNKSNGKVSRGPEALLSRDRWGSFSR